MTNPLKTTWRSRDTLELVKEARKNRPDAWAALYERCAEGMRSFCRRLVGPEDPLRRIYETEDIVQEAFLAAMEHISRLENDAAFYAWVRTIIRRRISLKRRDTLRDRTDFDPNDRPSLDSFESEVALSDEALRVLDAILVLFPEYPEAMAIFSYVHFEDGCKPEVLADALGLSRRTVYRRLDEAAKLLRARLEG
ncbi:MAG: sigma-70 family RNA polymerase sigma factor [Planctomycetes bacterium]|nr:sigma-70 family RNA polymerase sigma factor [Planctomycetota bacterium]